MTPTQRFENKVKQLSKAGGDVHYLSTVVYATDVLQLLLAEHRRVLALVRKHRKKHWDAGHRNMAYLEGVLTACDDILKALAGQKERHP